MRAAISAIVLGAMTLSGCGGGGGGGGDGGGGAVTVAPTPTPTTSAQCALQTLAQRQQWVLSEMREWYLFPETLPAQINGSAYSNLDDYLDALTATARGQGRDRYFTYMTSAQKENAYLSSGESAGYGFRLGLTSDKRLLITEAYEQGPALTAGIDRGTEILAIGTSEASLRTVSDILTQGGTDALNSALGPDDSGTMRYFRISDGAGTRVVAVTKRVFTFTPVSNRYGARVLVSNGRNIGYINLRSFIESADPELTKAFNNFRAQGITEFIIDLRYNGGGLVKTSVLFGNLLGGNRRTTDVFLRTRFRTEKSSNNEESRFAPMAESVSPTKIAFIGTGATASASEALINGLTPFYGDNIALIGTNTYGKPVGQIARQLDNCDDRLRVIAFYTANGLNEGEYFTGLASKMRRTCAARDNVAYPLGDVREDAISTAITFLNGGSCTSMTTATATASTSRSAVAADTRIDLLTPRRPTPAQRDLPGVF